MTKLNDPTAAEIAAACLLIQATWSPDERLRRLRADLRPMVTTADGRLVAVSASDYETHKRNGAPCQRIPSTTAPAGRTDHRDGIGNWKIT